MPEPLDGLPHHDWDDLRARLDQRIRPAMLFGLHNAELVGTSGRERVGEWADWILDTILDELRKRAP